jgi:hypothetical protein
MFDGGTENELDNARGLPVCRGQCDDVGDGRQQPDRVCRRVVIGVGPFRGGLADATDLANVRDPPSHGTFAEVGKMYLRRCNVVENDGCTPRGLFYSQAAAVDEVCEIECCRFVRNSGLMFEFPRAGLKHRGSGSESDVVLEGVAGVIVHSAVVPFEIADVAGCEVESTGSAVVVVSQTVIVERLVARWGVSRCRLCLFEGLSSTEDGAALCLAAGSSATLVACVLELCRTSGAGGCLARWNLIGRLCVSGPIVLL